jgi:hypothetical protein
MRLASSASAWARAARASAPASHCADEPRDGRVGDDRPEHGRLGPKHRDVGQAVPAEGDRERNVQQDLARIVHRPWLAPRRQRHRYRRIQAGLADRLHQQHRPGLGDHRTAAALDADTRVRPDTLLHLGIASFLAANRALSKSYRWQEHFPRSRSALGQAISRKREANARQCVL